MEAPAIKSQEFSRARFALRKVHLANIDRNNLRFTSLYFSRTGCVFRSKRRNGRETGNKIKSSLKQPPYERTPLYVCGRSRKSRLRATFASQERELSEKDCSTECHAKTFASSVPRIHNLQNPLRLSCFINADRLPLISQDF